MIYVILEDVFEDLPEDFETRFDNTNCKVNRLLLTRQNVYGLKKVGPDGKIHCVKSIRIQEITNQKKLHIWTLFTQCE